MTLCMCVCMGVLANFDHVTIHLFLLSYIMRSWKSSHGVLTFTMINRLINL